MNKGNSRTPLLTILQSIEREKKSGIQTKTEGTAFNHISIPISSNIGHVEFETILVNLLD